MHGTIYVSNDTNMEIDEGMSDQDLNDAVMDPVVVETNIVPRGDCKFKRNTNICYL